MLRPSKQDLRNALTAVAAAVLTVLLLSPFTRRAEPSYHQDPPSPADVKLDRRISVRFHQISTLEALKQIAQALHVDLDASDLSSDKQSRPIDLVADNIPARAIVDSILKFYEGNDTFATDGNRLIVNGLVLESPLINRIYDISDLVEYELDYRAGRGQTLNDLLVPNPITWRLSPRTATSLESLIESDLHELALEWPFYHEAYTFGGRLIVRAPIDAHQRIEELLHLLRMSTR